MKKQIFLFAVAALALASCSSENDVVQTPDVQQTAADEIAVNFDAYLNRGTTRAGQMGILTTEGLRNSTNAKDVSNGFGVLGYYTNDENYGQTSKPDFFYNQKVYYDNIQGVWNYDPIKYWPNEFGTTAISEGEDKLTFFAYAPYVPVNVNTGIAQRTEVDPATDPKTYVDELETGIIAITRNTAFGDPYVKYYASFDPAKCVDLCFGVAKADFKSSVDGEENKVLKGQPYIDVKKPKLTDRIHFDFKHALAQLNVQIDADIDQMSHGTNNYLDDKTRIFVREVTFEGFAEKGMLNLNSEAVTSDYDPKWVDLTGANEIKSGKVTIYDGRRDGREGQPNAHVTNENPQTLNTNIICNDTYSTNGVPATAPCNLFNSSSSDASVLVIPTTEALRVTIVYDVETEDENLAGFLCDGQTHGSSVENKITKEITLGGQGLVLKAGKKYQVNLHLGMNSVKFDASVTDWAEGPYVDVDLPVNAPIFTAEESPSATGVKVPYTAGDYVFGIAGLNGGEAVPAPADGTILSAATGNSANSSGLAKQSVTIAANATVKTRTEEMVWTGTASSKGVKLSFTQDPHPLGLSVLPENQVSLSVIPLKTTGEVKWGTGGDVTPIDNTEDSAIKVYRNGTPLTYAATPSTDGQFGVSWTGDKTIGRIYFAQLPTQISAKVGDVYTVYLKAGDADAETYSWRVKNSGAISYANSSVNWSLASPPSTGIAQEVTNPGDGIVTYSGRAVDNPTGKISVNKETGAVSFTIAPVAGDTFEIKATVTDTSNWHYTTAEVTYRIVITA